MRTRGMIVVAVGFFLSLPGILHAEKIPAAQPISEYRSEFITFSIPYAEFEQLPLSQPNISGATPLQDDKPNRLKIHLTLLNHSPQRKLDVSIPLEFSLTDEFNNQYHQIIPLADDPSAVKILNTNFPSFYPGEVFTQAVFFEPPVGHSQFLTLNINADGLEVDENIQLRIPRQEIQQLAEISPAPQINADGLIIRSPTPETAVAPGEKVRILTKFTQKEKPASITILAPPAIFTDATSAGRYDWHVPRTQRPGAFTIVVIAQWNPRGADPQIISRGVTIKIIDLKKKCLDKCLAEMQMTANPKNQ